MTAADAIRRVEETPAGRAALAAATLLVQLAALLLAVMTLLFFLVRLTGDPVLVLAGDSADPAVLDALRVKYGLDHSLAHQYWTFLANALHLDFGVSWINGRSAMELAWERIPATVGLALAGMLCNLAISIPAGVLLGSEKMPRLRRVLDLGVAVLQGIPGYVVALLLIQFFAVEWRLLPSAGNLGILNWILPSLTIAAFMAPKLIRVIAVNVSEAMREDYVVMARAQGASYGKCLVAHAFPNALLGATALIGAQIAGLLQGLIITETIFAWPGVGGLLLDSVLLLDFPVIQAVIVITTALVFIANWGADRAIEVIDPRLRRR